MKRKKQKKLTAKALANSLGIEAKKFRQMLRAAGYRKKRTSSS